MFDVAKLVVAAGDGGDGRVAFERQKYRPKGGPSGGDGGRGGDVVISTDQHLATLNHLQGVNKVVAQSGQAGSKRHRRGSDAERTEVKVPVGTKVWVLAEAHSPQAKSITPRPLFDESIVDLAPNRPLRRYQLAEEGQFVPDNPDDRIWFGPSEVLEQVSIESQLLPLTKQQEAVLTTNLRANTDVRSWSRYLAAELLAPNQSITIAQGGKGGRGNDFFKSSRLTTPLLAEFGQRGEKRVVLLELQLVADVGLIGLPNAGKSTLLSVVTSAEPKIGAYPFTTLHPQLGIMKGVDGGKVILADLPGLIEQAHQGKGLGYEFLRHSQRAQMLWFVISVQPEFMNQLVDHEQILTHLKHQIAILEQELIGYNPSLTTKPQAVVLSKIDLYPPELIEYLQEQLTTKNRPVVAISAATGVGLGDLKQLVQRR